MQFIMPDFIPAVPEMFVLAMACLVLLVDLFVKQRDGQPLTYLLSQLTLVGAAFLTVYLYEQKPLITFNGHFILDHLGCLLKLSVYGVSFFCLLYIKDYTQQRKLPFGETYVLCLLSILGMMVLISAYSFITLYLGLELMSLPIYAMIAFRHQSSVCSEAAMKYFVMGAVASGMLLYGLSMIYGATGVLTIHSVVATISQLASGQQLILVFGLVFVVVGIAFKLGAVPFHMWVPDVYEGAPTSITLFLSTGPKIAAFALAARLLIDTMPMFHPQWQQLLIAVGLLSMGLGNFVAVVQTNFKRMLAYSSIAHMGYLLLGLLSGTSVGYGAAAFYVLVYAIMTLGAFGMIVLLSHSGFEAENIEDFKGLNQRNPWLAFIMLLVMFSMAGVPPLVGFFAKVAVIEALVAVDLIWVAVLAVLFAVVGAYYYIRIIKVMYFDQADGLSPLVIPSVNQKLAITINGLAILLMGLFPTGLFELCQMGFLK